MVGAVSPRDLPFAHLVSTGFGPIHSHTFWVAALIWIQSPTYRVLRADAPCPCLPIGLSHAIGEQLPGFPIIYVPLAF
jgi:hypothetical protein